LILNDASYIFERWHGTMLVIAIAVFSVVFNTLLAKKLPLVEIIILILYIIGFFAIIIPLWVLSPRQNAHDVFTQFTNAGGWSTTGTAFMVGLSGIVASFGGFDCVVHMCRWRVPPAFKWI
jgi:amino acid transporter